MKRCAPWLLVAAIGCGDDGSPAAATGSTGESATTDAPVTSTGPGADGSGTESGTTGEPPAPAGVPLCDEADIADVEARIDEALAALSVVDKVTLLHGAGILPIDGTWLVEGYPDLAIPGLHMLDGPRGVSRMAGVNATAFPVGMLRGATWDPQLEQRVGEAMAREIRATGADTILAPTINILRHPGWGRAQETYSEDSMHLGEMGVGFIEGVQSLDVVATAKHYAANSIEDTRFDVNVTVDETSLREVYLPHFRRAVVDARVGAVMSAYNSVNGSYCDENAPLLREILKNEWGFSGLVMSDWIYGTHGDVTSLLAGLDIEMPTGPHFSALPGAVADGTLDEAEIDAAVRRVLRVQWCFGLDVDPPVVDPAQRETPEHLALAREVAQRGMVLLRNEAALPLSLGPAAEIVVVGTLAAVPNIGDQGSSAVDPSHVVTALEGIETRAMADAITVTYLNADALGPGDAATIMAADAVLVVAGLTDADEGEGLIAAGDRDSLLLPTAQVDLITEVAAIGTPTTVVLYGGGTIVVSDWVDTVDALLLAFYPGAEGGHAMADLLFGDVAPSGRLPFSVPFAEDDLVEFDHVSFEVTYGDLHGYRYLDAQGTAAQFPFGFGLTYTDFAIGEVTLDTETLAAGESLTATAMVHNTGATEAIATVQLYVGRPGAMAPRELRAFGQVSLGPGASDSVALTVTADDLRSWDPAAHAWTLVPGDYVVEVGTSAADLPFSTSLSVSG